MLNLQYMISKLLKLLRINKNNLKIKMILKIHWCIQITMMILGWRSSTVSLCIHSRVRELTRLTHFFRWIPIRDIKRLLKIIAWNKEVLYTNKIYLISTTLLRSNFSWNKENVSLINHFENLNPPLFIENEKDWIAKNKNEKP